MAEQLQNFTPQAWMQQIESRLHAAEASRRVTIVRYPTYTTVARPSAVTVGVGAAIYDTTISKPVFSDGAVWRDAAGTAV